jgi:hypothetical protein
MQTYFPELQLRIFLTAKYGRMRAACQGDYWRLIDRKPPAWGSLPRIGNRFEKLRFYEPKLGDFCAKNLISNDFGREKSV